MSDIRYIGINFLGYGIIPRLVMMDEKLHIISKGLYAYLCAYTGGGAHAIPPINKICEELKISNNTFRGALQELFDNKYINYDMVDDNTISVTIHNNVQINSQENGKPVVQDDYDSLKNMLKKQFDYEIFVESYGQKEIVDEILALVCEMWYADNIIANKLSYKQEIVRERIKRIDVLIMLKIVETFTFKVMGKPDQNGIRIVSNPRNYKKVIIFNAIDQEINRLSLDGNGGSYEG